MFYVYDKKLGFLPMGITASYDEAHRLTKEVQEGRFMVEGNPMLNGFQQMYIGALWTWGFESEPNGNWIRTRCGVDIMSADGFEKFVEKETI